MPDAALIESQTLNLPVDHVDTDQIYPARYLTTTDREGLGRFGFHDWRHNPESDKHRYFSGYDPEVQRILVSGENFGCGSSREHAAWALLDMGFRAVVSTGFGDIFYSNAPRNGLLLVVVEEAALAYLLRHDRHRLRIDIRSRTVEIPGYGTVEFPLDAFTAYCLINGIDALDYLQQQLGQIVTFERDTGR